MRADVGHGPELARADLGIAAAIFVAALASRIPFRSQLAYHWDSAQLARAVLKYDIRINQPHPPGFYLYVVLGRLLNSLVGDPHAALVWLSVLAGAWLTAVGFLLATSMFGRQCGLGTGLMLLTSPLCWFHSEIALTTIVDSALVVSFMFACWRAVQQGVTWLRILAMAALLAAVAGVRQQSAPCLIPVWLYVLWRFARPRGCKLSGAVVLLTGLSLLWFVPTVKSAGGLASYFQLVRLKSQIDASRTVWGGGGTEALFSDGFCIGRACWVGLSAAGIIALAELVCRSLFEKRMPEDNFYQTNRTQFRILLLWIAPIMAFDLFFMYAAMPGHILNFFPALVILTSLGLVKVAERLATSSEASRSRAFCGVLALVVTVNTVVFVWSPRWTTPLQLGLPLTAVEIGDHDAKLSACFQTIRQNWPPKNVIICHCRENFYWGLAQFAYYLPEYRNIMLGKDTSSPGALMTFPPGQDILIVVPPGESIDKFQTYIDLQTMSLVLDAGIKLYLCHS
jgi:hypothetical protein